MKVGVIAVQGDVSEHIQAFESAGDRLDVGVEATPVRSSGTVPDCDIVAVPGGESTTISNLLSREGIDAEIERHVRDDGCVFATCAGLIVLSRKTGDKVDNLGLLDVEVERNAFGRQRDSFEAEIDIEFGDRSVPEFPAVFIRAPKVTDVGGQAETVSRFNGDVVGVRQNNVLATSFHPELTGDYRIHQLLLEKYS